MTSNQPPTTKNNSKELKKIDIDSMLEMPIVSAREYLGTIQAQQRLEWAFKKFKNKFCITSSFGIQSSVLLHMLSQIQGGKNIPVIWVDTGYLPKETYCYAEQLSNKFDLNIKVFQSEISPARMEALHGKLWATESLEDLEKYHLIRKVTPLEEALENLEIYCWASGVRGSQTDHRKSMNWLDVIRGRMSLRPLLDWTNKDIYYYMKENNLPQHPLFDKGYSSVGDWHSSSPEDHETKGRGTRFGGLKEECGIHVQGVMGEGI